MSITCKTSGSNWPPLDTETNGRFSLLYFTWFSLSNVGIQTTFREPRQVDGVDGARHAVGIDVGVDIDHTAQIRLRVRRTCEQTGTETYPDDSLDRETP